MTSKSVTRSGGWAPPPSIFWLRRYTIVPKGIGSHSHNSVTQSLLIVEANKKTIWVTWISARTFSLIKIFLTVKLEHSHWHLFRIGSKFWPRLEVIAWWYIILFLFASRLMILLWKEAIRHNIELFPSNIYIVIHFIFVSIYMIIYFCLKLQARKEENKGHYRSTMKISFRDFSLTLSERTATIVVTDCFWTERHYSLMIGNSCICITIYSL